MDYKAQFIAENVLKENTTKILDEIRHLMEDEGVKACLNKHDKKNKPPGRSQFQSLMNAVEEAACVEELELFLYYQKSKTDGWGVKCTNDSTIAEKVVASFVKMINEIYPCMEETFEAEKIKRDERVLRLKIAEKYIGYLYWYASAVIPKEENDVS